MTPLELKDCLISDPVTTNPCFAALMQRYHHSLQSSLRYYRLNPEVRNDLALEAMEKFVESLKTKEKYRSPKYLPLPIIQSILKNIRRAYMRKEKKLPETTDFQDINNSLEFATHQESNEEPYVRPLPIEMRIQACLTRKERSILAMEYGPKRLSMDEINGEFRVSPKKLEKIKQHSVRKIRNKIIEEASREMVIFLRSFAKRKTLDLLACLIENTEDLERIRTLFGGKSDHYKKSDVREWLKTDGAKYKKLVATLVEFRFVLSVAQNPEMAQLLENNMDKWHLVEGYFFDTLSAEELWSIQNKSELSRAWSEDFKLQVAILALIRLDALLEREPNFDGANEAEGAY